MSIRPLVALALLTLPIAACSSGGTPTGDATAANSANAMMDMPRPDGRPFDPHTLPMYPGAKMIDMKIMAHTARDDMAYSFAAPASLATVHAWFADALPKAGAQITEAGDGFTGTDKAGHPFRLDLTSTGAAATTGTITSAG